MRRESHRPFVSLGAAAARLRAGAESVFVVGRLRSADGVAFLVDAQGSLPLSEAIADEGELVSGLVSGAAPYQMRDVAVLARSVSAPCPEDVELARRLPDLARRDRVLRAVRAFFHERGFLEVTTPALVRCPGLEPHLVALPAGDDRYLATSPELHLKRLLAAGAPRLFEIAHAFRGDEGGPWHLREFAMLEWYRPHEGLAALMDDCEELLRAAARATDLAGPARGCDLSLPAERLTVREAFERHAGLDLADHRERDALAGALRERGLAVDEGDDWDDLFFRLFLERIEPKLGRERMTFLSEYPASQAALARVRNDEDWPVALRFELYAGGLELANAFDELTDPIEQRRRHEADRAERRRLGRETPPLDERFLAALAAGHPPAAGIALGLDRLIALVLGAENLGEIVAFGDE